MKRFLNKRNIFVCGLLLTVFAFFAFVGDNRNFQMAKNLNIFNAIFKELDMFYVDTIQPDKVIQNGIDAMLMQ